MKRNVLTGSFLLASSILLYSQEVQAGEIQTPQEDPSNVYVNALYEAQDQGIILVHDDIKIISNKEELDQAYLLQAQEVSTATQQYQLEKETYAKEWANYEAALKEIERHQELETQRQKEIEAAQKQYQADQALYQAAEVQYQKELKAYQEQQQQIQDQEKSYQLELERYQKDLAQYQAQEADYQTQKVQQEAAQASFLQKQADYQKELELYQRAQTAYQEALQKAQTESQKEGALSQVYAQYLIAKSEPNATVTFEGVDFFIDPSHKFGNGLDGIAGTISKLPLTTKASLFKEVGAGTPAGSGNGYGLILEQNKPIQVTYNNLTNTSYNGKQINRLIYTYELLSTFAEDKKATAFIYTDPTKTIYGDL